MSDMPTIIRVEFEDNGQDFLQWDVDAKSGLIVDCQPFQYTLWCNGKTHVAKPTNIHPGSIIGIFDNAQSAESGGSMRTIKHRAKRAYEVSADWLHTQNLAKAGYDVQIIPKPQIAAREGGAK